jgi:hypothetical protein
MKISNIPRSMLNKTSIIDRKVKPWLSLQKEAVLVTSLSISKSRTFLCSPDLLRSPAYGGS